MPRYTAPVIGALVALAVIGGIFWGIVGYWMDADDRFWQWLTETFWGRGHWPNGWNLFGATPWAYLVLAVVAGVVAFAIFRPSDRYGEGGKRLGSTIVGLVALVLLWACPFTLIVGADDRSDSWAGETRFVVADPAQLPTSLRRVDSQYIEQGAFSQSWEPRVASATGANTVISRSSESDSGTTLLNDTLTYTYGQNPGWTAIRDGRKQQPLFGVAFWPGQGNVETCRFTGEFSINKAFHGRMGKSLLDELAAFNKSLFFEEQDMWGFCQPAGDPSTVTDDQPIIVVPVKTWDGAGNRSTWYSAGVLVITGSPSGDVVIEHVKNVEPGQYPGPVYPVSLAAEQREETQFMAGKWNKWFRDFGFETTRAESQAGNSSEFLLRSTVDGRLYWVTPLTARSSDSQIVSAYSLIPADEATFDEVNDLRVYVLQAEDPRLVNFDDLEARVRQAISSENPGFFGAGGTLVEFLPLDDSSWQVYAELGGRVVYRITVPMDSRISPVVTSLDGIDEAAVEDAQPGSTDQGDPAGSSCAADLSSLDNEQLLSCLSAIADELDRRQEP
jgi:hypothetical protein